MLYILKPTIVCCVQKQIAEEEKVQRAALDLLTSRQKGCKKTMEEVIEESECGELVGNFYMHKIHTHAYTDHTHTHTCTHVHTQIIIIVKIV